MQTLTDMSFKTWLESQMVYVSPDTIWKPGSTAFIYTGGVAGLNSMYYAGEDNHDELMQSNEELYDYCYELTVGKTGVKTSTRNMAMKVGFLVGRSIPAGVYRLKTTVSFWDNKPEDFDKLLTPCLERLEKDKIVGSDYLVSTPYIGTVEISELRQETPTVPVKKELSPEEQDELELQKNLHTMHADVKRSAMKKLGLGKNFGSGKKTFWSRARDMGLIQPGITGRNLTSENSYLSHPAQIAFNSVSEAADTIRKFVQNLKGKQVVPQQDVYGIADAAQKLYSAIINTDKNTRGDIETGQHTEALSNRVYYAMKDIDMIVSDMRDNSERYGDMATSAVSRLGGNGYNQTARTAGNNQPKDMYKKLVDLRQKIRSAYDNMFKD